MVHVLPAKLGGALAPGVTQLQADVGAAVAMDELDDAAEGPFLCVVPQPGAAGGDARLRGWTGHLHEHQGGAA